MSIWQKFKDFFDLSEGKEPAIIFEKEEQVTATPPVNPENNYTKFNAEFHNPRLSCFGCNNSIEIGKVRFMNVNGEEKAFHKSCLNKMKSGKVPEQS